MVVDAKTNRLTGGISAMPDPDLDQLRTAAAEASGRLLSALHGRQARLRAELDQVEAEIAAHERAVLPALAALGTVPASPPPNGRPTDAEATARLLAAPAAEAVEALIGGRADERDTPIIEVLAELAPRIQQSLLADCRFCGIETVRHLVDYIRADGEIEGPRTLQDLCSTENEVKYFSLQLRQWAQRNGWPLADLGVDGLPQSWLAEAEPAKQEPPEPKPKKQKPPVPKPPAGVESWCDLHPAKKPSWDRPFDFEITVPAVGGDQVVRVECSRPSDLSNVCYHGKISETGFRSTHVDRDQRHGLSPVAHATGTARVLALHAGVKVQRPEGRPTWWDHSIESLLSLNSAQWKQLRKAGVDILGDLAEAHAFMRGGPVIDMKPSGQSLSMKTYQAAVENLSLNHPKWLADTLTLFSEAAVTTIGKPAPYVPAKPVPAAVRTGLDDGSRVWKPADLLEALTDGLAIEPRWGRMKKHGATDDELIVAIAESFGEPGLAQSGDAWSVDVSKKLGPRYWSSAAGKDSKKPATLSGPSLLTAVRAVLEIPQPKQ